MGVLLGILGMQEAITSNNFLSQIKKRNVV